MTPDPLILPKRFFFVPGVEVPADGDIHQWHFAAERIIEGNGWGTADQYAYNSPIITRGLRQAAYVSAVGECLWDRKDKAEYKYVAGHSNGCAIILAALAANPEVCIDEVHLFAAAVSGDYEENGLNAMIGRGQIGRVVWYCSESDSALKWARRVKWLKRFGLGAWAFGYGGLTGPQNKAAGEPVYRTLDRWFVGWDHSDYFKGGRLAGFLREMATGEPFKDTEG